MSRPILTFACLRCGATFTARVEEPERCKTCHSIEWDMPPRPPGKARRYMDGSPSHGTGPAPRANVYGIGRAVGYRGR